MRVYQLRNYEVLLNDQQAEELSLLHQYEQLCGRLLTLEALAASRAIEIARMNHSRMEQRPSRIQRFLAARQFPPFQFLIAKN